MNATLVDDDSRDADSINDVDGDDQEMYNNELVVDDDDDCNYQCATVQFLQGTDTKKNRMLRGLLGPLSNLSGGILSRDLRLQGCHAHMFIIEEDAYFNGW